ncbi:AMP-binding protein [Sphingopyxis sp. SE2]|uniref:AMP-binding protein n=1 Tax=Sphingopyxis sp. SE2 TaxID=1586240 RepID=UPI0028C18014|nr:AMP-binding protein [Sphingopyxis sp. SE2]MDT7529115.1 AMP-binding protein [Sphingopyxis sp. SE2]
MSSESAAGAVMRRALPSAMAVEALEAGPWRDLLPCWTLAGAIEEAASRFPDKAAIVQLDDDAMGSPRLSFAEYRDRIFRAANLFRRGRGDAEPVVAVIMPFLPEAFVAMWAGGIAGRYVPINPFLDVEHVAAILNAAKADILVSVPPERGRGVWERLDALLERVPSIAQVWLAGADASDARCFEAALGREDSALGFVPATDPAGVCAYLHTGGTTGSPKLVRHTHEGQLFQGWLCGMAMGPEEDVIFGHAMPNFHVGGAIASGTRGIVYGQTIVTLTADGFRNPAVMPRFWDIVRREGITAIVTAPTTAAGLADAEGDGPASLVRYTTGGGPLPLEVARAFDRRFGIQLKEVWGGTEFHGILSFHYDGGVPPRLGSCGRVVPYHRVISAVLDGNRFVREAAADERGVLIAAGPTLIPGYVDPAADKSFFVEGGPDGLVWATTGDIGMVDEDHYVWIYGREKDVIIRGGHNIDSAAIDEILAQHPAVLHAAAIGRPCPSKGELPIAYVELKPGARVAEGELAAHARAKIQERAAVPVDIILLEALPMTAVGKVSKPHLRIMAMEAVGRAACPGRDVAVEEKGGKLTLVVTAEDVADRARIERILAPYTFTTRVDLTGAFA